MQSSSNNFLLNLDADPLKKTVNMDSTTWAWAFTGIE
jgi:hypothetical protein